MVHGALHIAHTPIYTRLLPLFSDIQRTYCNIPILFIHTLEYLPKTLAQWHRHRCFDRFNSLSPTSTFDMETESFWKFNIHLLFIMNLFICEFSLNAIASRGIHGLLVSFLCGFVFLLVFFSCCFSLDFIFTFIYQIHISFISFNAGMKFAHRCLPLLFTFLCHLLCCCMQIFFLFCHFMAFFVTRLFFSFFFFFSPHYYRVFVSSV